MNFSQKHGKKNEIRLLSITPLANLFKTLSIQTIDFEYFFQGYRNRESNETLHKLYGNFLFARDHISIRHGVGKIFLKFKQSALKGFLYHKSIELLLPGNPLVFEKSGGEVVVVISGKEQSVVKLESHVHAYKYYQITKKSWEAFKAANMQGFLPEFLGGGETSTPSVYYTKTRFCPNKPPLFRSFKANAWPRVLERRVLPILKEFHSRNGFQLLSGTEWARLIAAKYENRTMPESMCEAWQGSLAKLEAFGGKLMPVGMISADLQPQNIHFYDGKIVILDWSNIETAALLIDVVCDVFYPAMASPETANSVAYWDFLCNSYSLNQLPKVLQDFYQVWRRWVGDWMGLEVSERMYRLQLEGICWDWMGTMTHTWLQDRSLWREIRFPERFLNYCAQAEWLNCE